MLSPQEQTKGFAMAARVVSTLIRAPARVQQMIFIKNCLVSRCPCYYRLRRISWRTGLFLGHQTMSRFGPSSGLSQRITLLSLFWHRYLLRITNIHACLCIMNLRFWIKHNLRIIRKVFCKYKIKIISIKRWFSTYKSERLITRILPTEFHKNGSIISP